MEQLRYKIGMFSVNQIAIYHTLHETFNVVRNSSSEQVKEKWEHKNNGNFNLRRMDNTQLRVPERARVKCTGFSYHGAKIFNMLPSETRNCETPENFKTLIKKWIWDTIPSY